MNPSIHETFCQRVVATATTHADKVAMSVIESDEVKTITYGSMLAQVRSVAYRLSCEKIAFGDRVALISENHPEWAIAYLGVIYRGAVVTPLDPAATVVALASFLNDSEARLAFVSSLALDKFRAACELIQKNIPAVILGAPERTGGLSTFEEWTTTPVPDEFRDAAPPAGHKDLAVLIYTSGTTGSPKAVPLTHGNIYAESDKIQEVMRLSAQEVILSLLPLFHAYSQIVNLWLAATVGAQVVYIAELSSAGIERGLKRSGATALIGVPRLWYLFHKKIWDAVAIRPWIFRVLFKVMLSVSGWFRRHLNLNLGPLLFRTVHKSFGGKLRLAVSGGASFDVDVARDFYHLGFTILQGYGLTETCGAATVTRFEDNKIGSVGTALNGVEIRLDLPNHEGIGEVLIRGPIVMSGYYKNPKATQAAFTSDGWFKSGDLGRFDKQGHLYIVGRLKDVIKLPSGKNVFPEDVEAHYERSPYVSEVCILGIKDDSTQFKGAEKLCAVVVPKFEYLRSQHIGSVREWVIWDLENIGRDLPEYQRVHDFILRAEPLPRTSTRKIRRFELQKEVMQLRDREGGPAKVIEVSDADRMLMDTSAGRIVIATLTPLTRRVEKISPQMNLEIDLGLDSLARAECFVSLEQKLGFQLKPDEGSLIQTVGELVRLVNARTSLDGRSTERAGQVQWNELLSETSAASPEVVQLLRPKTVLSNAAYAVLRLVYWGARFFFRMEVSGREVLSQIEPPYLICPNHQSYLDPFLVCSTYPRKVLKSTFHVGASMYFTNRLMAKLGRLINVVPIDPDAELLRAMRVGAVGLRAGKILNIYPEGQRSFDGQLLEFKKGAAILATELNLPIIPVALDGTYLIWSRRSLRFHLAKVKIWFGQPIFPRELSPRETEAEAAYSKVTAEARHQIERMLEEMRLTSLEGPGVLRPSEPVQDRPDGSRSH